MTAMVEIKMKANYVAENDTSNGMCDSYLTTQIDGSFLIAITDISVRYDDEALWCCLHINVDNKTVRPAPRTITLSASNPHAANKAKNEDRKKVISNRVMHTRSFRARKRLDHQPE